jgi:hypothetical protein
MRVMSQYVDIGSKLVSLTITKTYDVMRVMRVMPYFDED